MECTFLLGKPPTPKRKKPPSEVEILEARLESIESAYSERLSQMEALLRRVMPAAEAQELLLKEGIESSTAHAPLSAKVAITTTAVSGSKGKSSTSTSDRQQSTSVTNEEEWVDNESLQESSLSAEPNWDQPAASQSTNTLTTALMSPELTMTSNTGTPQKDLKEETYEGSLFTPVSRVLTLPKSPAPSVTHSLASTGDNVRGESDGDEGGLGELAATMDKLRLFDASMYYGKGTMLFTSTDQSQFWDEEISFDVHDAQDIAIPPEALVMPPLEVIDELFDIYYAHYYVFLPMIQKTALLQALEDRHEPQSIFLLNTVFMAAALCADCKHPACYSDINDPKTLSTPFFERARMVLDYCMGIPRVSTVQGLIMLSRCPKVCGLGHHYIQQAVLMAADLGLHRKCDRWIPDLQVQETRKRVFWCVYVMDSATASITGRRPLLDDNEIDVEQVVPSVAEGELEYTNTLFLVHMCYLWRIFRNVKQYIFNAVEAQDMVPGSLPKNYEQQLIQWQLQLPAALRFSFDIKAGDPEAMYNARGGVVQMLYEATLILLHKPYLSSPDHAKRSLYRSEDICIKAATKITDVAKMLIKTYSRTFEITGIPEYSMTNAVRIQVMYMKSPDAKVAEAAQANFEYLVRFFREFYSSPRANLDDQMINCILTFFEEFIHSVKGLSESTVHICAGAIKNMAIAKRSKIALGRGHGHGHAHDHDPSASDGSSCRTPGSGRDNLSRLVKIGREERAKARAYCALTSPSMSLMDGTVSGTQRKRNSYMQHDGQSRYSSNQPLQQSPDLNSSPGAQQESIKCLKYSSTDKSSSPTPLSTSLDSTGAYHHPGKFQKVVSQYVGPFGGPLVMESLSQYQTSTAILSQPPSNSAIPQSSSIMSDTSGVLDVFSQQQQLQQRYQPQVQQQQQQQQQRQQQQLQQSPHAQPEQVYLQQQHQQSIYYPTAPPSSSMNGLNASFWNDFTAMAGDAQHPIQVSNMGGTQSPDTVAGRVGMSPVALVSSLEGAPGMLSSSGMFGMPTSVVFNPAQQHGQQHGQHGAVTGAGVRRGDLSADQLQVLLEQTLADDTRNDFHPNHDPSSNSHFSASSFLQQGPQHPSPAQHPLHQQLTQSQPVDLNGSQENFQSSSWHGMM
ncbi:Transcriptional activator of fatty acid utilization [Mortierella claussenii]|nr:Transcriptional activator of fatty acid utilization [Mortierella claussenii]